MAQSPFQNESDALNFLAPSPLPQLLENYLRCHKDLILIQVYMDQFRASTKSLTSEGSSYMQRRQTITPSFISLCKMPPDSACLTASYKKFHIPSSSEGFIFKCSKSGHNLMNQGSQNCKAFVRWY